MGVVLALLLFALCASADRLETPPQSSPDVVLIRAGYFEMGSDEEDVAFAARLCALHAEERGICQLERCSSMLPLPELEYSARQLERLQLPAA